MTATKMVVVQARIRMLDTEEGGRYTPFITGYRPNFVFNAAHNRDGQITLLDREQMKPGEQGNVLIRILVHSRNPYPHPPAADDLFLIREGGKILGEGIIQHVVDIIEFEPEEALSA